jgi:hypothetical protein
MKKYIIPATLLVMISLTSVSCKKETIANQPTAHVENCNTRIIQYSVNGQTYHRAILNDDDWNTFMSSMLALAREGYIVTIMDENRSLYENCPKETVTFTTKNEDEANQWAFKKTLEGYVVEITFNRETGEFTCIANR